MMNRKLAVGGLLHRLLRRSPVVVAFLCAVILAFVSFYNSNKLQNRHNHGGTSMRQIYDEPESFQLADRRYPSPPPSSDELEKNSSMKSLKELVRDAVDRGLVVIVNASDTDAARVLADHWHGSRLDISGALDGPIGDILVEVMQELRNMEDMALEVAELKRKIKRLEHHQKEKKRSGFNGTSSGMVQDTQGFRPAGRSLHSLLLFSSFRFALDEFTAVGLVAPSLLPNPIPEVEESSCTWVEWDEGEPSPSPSTTSARVQHGTKRTIVISEGEAPYAVVVIKCLFADPAGSNGYGGHLFINSSGHGENDHVPVLSERPESVNKIQFEGPLQHRFAVCTPPIWKPINAKALREWLMYHHELLGRERIHYFFYTGIPLDDATMKLLQPLLDESMASIIEMEEMEESRFPSSLLARNDCVHRSRFFADWAVLWDFNEFLQMLPPTSFLPLVASNEDLPCIAFGNQRWSSAYCLPDTPSSSEGPSSHNSTAAVVPLEESSRQQQWATDRMVFRLELAPCPSKNQSSSSTECVGGEGQRRHLVNPRKVYAVHHHFIIDPSWGGADIPTDKARLNQWIGNFLSTDPEEEATCTIIKEPLPDPSMAVDGYWFMDLSFSASSQPAHHPSSSLFSTR